MEYRGIGQQGLLKQRNAVEIGLGKGTTSTACGKMLWKTIDVKAAACSDDVRNCETSCSFKFPASANFAANFSTMKPENLKLCPKSGSG